MSRASTPPSPSTPPAAPVEAIFAVSEPPGPPAPARGDGAATAGSSLPDVAQLAMGEVDLHLFHEGRHLRLHEKLGAHLARRGDEEGVFFAAWAPNAEAVAVIGDFNGWDPARHPMQRRGILGIWEVFVPGAQAGQRYKLKIVSRDGDYTIDKADPFGFRHEAPPGTSSVVADVAYRWGDEAHMSARSKSGLRNAPMSIYEVHLGSWMRIPEEEDRMLTYREIAPRLADHVAKLGFTHVELMPLTEHPFYGSWGYQTTGYFAATARYGDPADLKFLIDTLHQRGIGVILDWVPGHFPHDAHGLSFFDGTHLFEHASPLQGYHPEWNTYIFNYGRHEVRSFLLSSAMYWVEQFHADGLRVDGVASMLYLDYGREGGEWVPNQHGGRENLEAVALLRQLNEAVYQQVPGVETIAEESTAWPLVSRPTYLGGLGFGFKWDLGWMHDTLKYLALDPIHRKFHHRSLTFRGMYAFSENFVLALSHDEVVYGKGSLINKMNGDRWQKFANLRLLYTYMWTQPGKKLLFMGGEFAQWREWNHDVSLDWHLTNEDAHRQIQLLVGELNRAYREEPALHALDCDARGFQWIDANDADHSVLVYERRGTREEDRIVVALNFTPVPLYNYRIGVPGAGTWEELLNTDATTFGGSGQGNLGAVEAAPVPWQNRDFSLALTLPPLGAVLLKPRIEPRVDPGLKPPEEAPPEAP
ncbi:1,4-alpha-glucan branching protein GlgB [Chondromyces crocatus]|uniref:1,4-alpha-glucan branching enzyme GlgB n=1 Tax=Chondromyces crocatus TaxID=52 RepID=A0A0K1E9K5_CHOCO|nr:1,4-alpha-glucan branching protein GlgB [Chondromyces crocatus]AKT37258.1 glycogen branching protein [Chondromyces crocatus]